MDKKIIKLIEEKGPLIGSEIWKIVAGDGLTLWRSCKMSKNLIIRTIGTKYLRLDPRVDGFARLSPSIFREFLTYSIIGIPGDPDSLERRVRDQISHIEEVSKEKLELAYRSISSLVSSFESEWIPDYQACFIIAGDIVYNMGHDMPRPERSTGKLVNGSDMDLVVIVDDQFPGDLMKRLDDAIYKEKYRLLMTPHIREEIDYVIKKVARVREQVRFDVFKHMVACKILREGTLLYGSEDLFGAVKVMLKEMNVPEKLNVLEKRARYFRKDAEDYLLFYDTKEVKERRAYFFYPTEESEEFE